MQIIRPSFSLAVAALLSTAFFVGACVDTGSVSNGNESSFNIEEPREESSVETDVFFVLENDTEVPIYVQVVDYGWASGPGWLDVFRDGDLLNLRRGCLPCACDADACAVCDLPLPSVEQIESGGKLRWDWDGVHYEVVDGEDGACTQEVEMQPRVLTAEICYGFEISIDEWDGEFVDEPSCEILEFELGIDKEVVVTVEEAPAPPPEEVGVDFAIENQSEEIVYVQLADYYTLSGPEWLTVEFDGDELHIRRGCLPCGCDEEVCAVCGAPLPAVVSIEPGSERRLHWDGVHYDVVDDGAGGNCTEDIQLVGGAMEATICYGFEVMYELGEPDTVAGEFVYDPRCETIGFELGVDDEVRVVVDESA